jgi:hypothetical protein
LTPTKTEKTEKTGISSKPRESKHIETLWDEQDIYYAHPIIQQVSHDLANNDLHVGMLNNANSPSPLMSNPDDDKGKNTLGRLAYYNSDNDFNHSPELISDSDLDDEYPVFKLNETDYDSRYNGNHCNLFYGFINTDDPNIVIHHTTIATTMSADDLNAIFPIIILQA